MDGYFTKPIRRDSWSQAMDRLTAGSPVPSDSSEKTGLAKVPPVIWNIGELMERLDGDQAFFRELLLLFRVHGDANLRKAREAFLRGDLPALSRAAHTLKGMLKNLSMISAAEIASTLEKASKDGAHLQCAAELEQLTQVLKALSPELEAKLVEVNT